MSMRSLSVELLGRRIKALPVVLAFSCVCLFPARALSSDQGPAFYNATDAAILIDVSYTQGSGLRGDLASGQMERWPFAWQVQSIKVQFKNGRSLGITEAEAASLRGKLIKPAAQVWIIDDTRICLVASRTFKAVKGVRCPGNG